MELLRKTISKFPIGIWLALVALFLALLGWGMQAYSLINWEAARELGLQSGTFSGSEIDKIIAQKEWGEAVADLIWPLPLGILAIAGILKKRFYGLAAALMEFSVCIYFPLFYLFQVGGTNPETVIAAMILWAIPSAIGIAGIISNKDFFTKDFVDVR